MKSMVISEGEKRENSVLSVADQPSYPHGLKLYLDPDTIAKLGISEAPEVGAKMGIMGIAEVVAVNKVEGRGDDDKFTIELQIQDLDVKGKSKEEKASNMLYGGEA